VENSNAIIIILGDEALLSVTAIISEHPTVGSSAGLAPVHKRRILESLQQPTVV